MDKIKLQLRNLSLRTSFVLYVSVFIVLAVVLILTTTTICQKLSDNIASIYSYDEGLYYLLTPDGEQVEISESMVHTWQSEESLSEQDKTKLSLLNLIINLSIPVYSVLCLIAVASLFFQRKLRKPFSILYTAQEKVSNNDLDFTISYENMDEMGKLILSFEKMRAALQSNNLQMWHQMEQRKQINSAFAHDLRTPLTVLKGYAEILQSNTNDRNVVNTAIIMEKHIERMERYVDSMSNLQKLEDISPNYKDSQLSILLAEIQQVATIICEGAGKQFDFYINVKSQSLKIDKDMILEVVENLVSNAAQYAKKEIHLSIKQNGNAIAIAVNDDGVGFSSEGLIKATEPYYSGETDRSKHFGLGLYISKVLCEQHGGNIQLQNTVCGAQVTATFICQ